MSFIHAFLLIHQAFLPRGPNAKLSAMCNWATFKHVMISMGFSDSKGHAQTTVVVLLPIASCLSMPNSLMKLIHHQQCRSLHKSHQKLLSVNSACQCMLPLLSSTDSVRDGETNAEREREKERVQGSRGEVPFKRQSTRCFKRVQALGQRFMLRGFRHVRVPLDVNTIQMKAGPSDVAHVLHFT